MSLCPCKSGKNYASCCQPMIQGKQTAQTALQLMSSRYSAFALGNSQYLLDTWHSEFRPESLALDPTIHWINLQIIESSVSNSNSAIVHFRAYSLIKDQLSILEEKSNFEKVNKQWFYTNGELSPNQNKKISRNASCPCGSGKKFKRCCYQQKLQKRL
ncbi:MAG: YchJ family protein [Pseudomonadota bacterium]